MERARSRGRDRIPESDGGEGLAPSASMTDDAGGSLCLECGLCCNGAMFDDVRLDDGDRVEPWRGLGVPLRATHGGHACPQPCAAFDGGACRIYSDRPASCRDFECRVLRRLHEGELTI